LRDGWEKGEEMLKGKEEIPGGGATHESREGGSDRISHRAKEAFHSHLTTSFVNGREKERQKSS